MSSGNTSRAFRVTAILGFLGVALGAFGAHGLKELLARRAGAESWWDKAVLYHFVHTLAMLRLCGLRPFATAPWTLFGAGILLFSGSLYLLAVAGWHWLVFVTPLGGVCFLAGWLWLAFGRTGAVDASSLDLPAPRE
jgi:uncharacterized membrane protein YgdD (TMEM256/DUF423 family)